MYLRLFILLLLSITIFAEIIQTGINLLTSESIISSLSQGQTVLAIWNPVGCKKCASDFWEVNSLFYALENEENFFVLANNIGTNETLDMMYSIEANTDGAIYRLFVNGSDVPLIPSEDGFDLKSWISQETGYTIQKDFVYDLSDETHSDFVKRTKKINSFIMLFIPQNANCQRLYLPFSNLARAFVNEKSIVFARVNCVESPNMCAFFNAPHVPAFRYIPWNETLFDGKQLRYDEGEDMLEYLNRHLDTFISADGGLNEDFGRNNELDVLAHAFMDANEREDKLFVMKQTAKLKNTYRSSYRYYKIMKDILHGGIDALQAEIASVEMELKDMIKKGKEYDKLIARNNIAHQFEVIHMNNAVISLTPYNFKYVVNGQRNVVVVFYAQWCKHCQEFLPIYNEIADEGLGDVVFAEINAELYSQIAKQFYVVGYPTILWFDKSNGKLPYLVDCERTKVKFTEYITSLLNPKKSENEVEL